MMMTNQPMPKVDIEKTKTLLLLFDGTLRFIQNAKQGITQNNFRLKSENISKVIAILTQLDCALDKNIGGELAINLSELYQYMMKRLTHANINDDSAAIEDVEKILCDLKDGFNGAAKKIKATNENTGKERGLRIDY